MEGIEKIKEKIIEEARSQAISIVEKAEEEAALKIKEAQEEADEKIKIEEEKAHIEALHKKNRLIAEANLETKKMKLKARQDVIEETFLEAIKRLNSLPQAKYKDMLVKMIGKRIETGNEEIILPKGHRDKFGKEIIHAVNKSLKNRGIKGEIFLSKEERNILSGFVIKQGNIEINSSFESILKLERDNLEFEVVKLLFPENF